MAKRLKHRKGSYCKNVRIHGHTRRMCFTAKGRFKKVR